MKYTRKQMQVDIDFLTERAAKSGAFVCDEERSWGRSSNAIVAFAYGGERPISDMPRDKSDYAACVRAVRLLPRHRRTVKVRAALKRARAAWQRSDWK